MAMITTITDEEISQHFSNTSKTLRVWKKSETRNIRERYAAFKDRVLLTKNGFNNSLDLIEENKNLKKELAEMEAEINIYVDKMETLRGLGK